MSIASRCHRIQGADVWMQVDWDDSKSDALWNIISEVERTERKIDCKSYSEHDGDS